jgi:Flp pilus assembly protein TadG
MRNILGSLEAKLNFLRDDRGTIAVITGYMMVLFCVCVGAGIDMGRTTSAAQRLGAALDVAALHVASQAGKTDAELKALAEPVMLKNYGGNTYDVVSGFDLVTEGKVLKVTAKVTVKTWLMSLVGIPTMEAFQKTEAIMGNGGNSLEVALVLDNTGSMNEDAGGGQTKIQALKVAATDFINTIVANEQTPYYSRVAIVPYAANVNPGTMLNSVRLAVNNSPANCQNWSCSTYKYWWNNNNNSRTYTMYPCVTERQGGDAASDTTMSSARAMYNYQYQGNNCVPSAVQPLTDQRTTLNNLIANMGTAGGTAGHIGIQWGWQTLSPTGGLGGITPSAYNASKVKKIMVIMTDGEFNTWHCNGMPNNATGGCNNGNGDSFNQAKDACNAMKVANKNIELYFVAVGLTATTAINQLTSACSSKAANIIMASDGAALKAAFQKIAAELQSMRLSF